jgi:hypothetical protein
MQQGNNNLLQQFMRFRNGFRGDPRQQVQQLLNSGKVSQAQYDNAVRIAQRLQGMFSGMG